MFADHGGAPPESRGDRQVGPDCSQPISKVLQADPIGVVDVEANPVVGDLEPQPIGAPPDRDVHHISSGVFHRILHRFEDAEVEGGLHLDRETGHVAYLEPNRNRAVVGGGLNRRSQTVLGERGGVDAVGQVAQLRLGLVQLTTQQLKRLFRPIGIFPQLRTGVGQAKVDGDEAGLGAVVEVPFDPATFPVGGGNDAGSGPGQLVGSFRQSILGPAAPGRAPTPVGSCSAAPRTR